MLNKNVEPPISIGIGTTGKCNLNCPHCYSNSVRNYSLSFERIKRFLDGKNVTSINYGTGENYLNSEFVKVVNYCHDRGIKQSLTSNGYSIKHLQDDIIQKFNDIDISLDFSNEKLQNEFRNGESWSLAQESIEKCVRVGVEYSIVTAVMSINFMEIPMLLEMVKNIRCNLRLNIFKRVPYSNNKIFELNYEEFWKAIKLLFLNGKLISCSEPIVNAMLDIPPIVKKSPCGIKSIRIHPDGKIVPCVYWPDSSLCIDKMEPLNSIFKSEPFQLVSEIPPYCLKNCELVDICGGGCASRRYLSDNIYEPDMYCPVYKDKPIPNIEITYDTNEKDLVHSSYLCTLIFSGK